VACWRTKAAISLKRANIEEKLLLTAYRNSPTLFQTVPSLTPYGIPFTKIGDLQLSYHLLSQEQVKLRTSNLADTFTGPIQVKATSKFRTKWSVGVSRDCPNFFECPLLSQKWVKLRTSNFVGTFIRSIGTKAHEYVGNSGRGRSQGVPKIFQDTHI